MNYSFIWHGYQRATIHKTHLVAWSLVQFYINSIIIVLRVESQLTAILFSS